MIYNNITASFGNLLVSDNKEKSLEIFKKLDVYIRVQNIDVKDEIYIAKEKYEDFANNYKTYLSICAVLFILFILILINVSRHINETKGFKLFNGLYIEQILLIIGTLICVVIIMNKKTKWFYEKLIEIPVVVPHIVVAIFILNIFSKSGLLARILYYLGIISSQDQFINLVYDKYGIGIILAYLWKEVPFIIYFVLSIMSNINDSLGEAAINLGASKYETFKRVTLPLCKNTILSGFLIIFVFALGAYEIPQLLGPTLPKALPVLSYIQYTHPNLQNRPYAMALNGITIIISLISAVIYYNLVKNNIPSMKEK